MGKFEDVLNWRGTSLEEMRANGTVAYQCQYAFRVCSTGEVCRRHDEDTAAYPKSWLRIGDDLVLHL